MQYFAFAKSVIYPITDFDVFKHWLNHRSGGLVKIWTIECIQNLYKSEPNIIQLMDKGERNCKLQKTITNY
jgi:hypothetical protein